MLSRISQVTTIAATFIAAVVLSPSAGTPRPTMPARSSRNLNSTKTLGASVDAAFLSGTARQKESAPGAPPVPATPAIALNTSP